MKKQIVFSVVLAASAVLADEAAQTAAEGETEAAVQQSAKVSSKVTFMTLPLCRQVEGDVFVRLNGSQEWKPAVEGHFYPLGSSFRTAGNGRLTVAFSADSSASIAGDAEFATRAQALGQRVRMVSLVRGTLELKLADNMPEGAFGVTAPGFVVKNPAGESCYIYEDMGDGDKVTVCCKTGSLGIDGRHFEIPAMRSADKVVIRTSRDMLSTFLYGTSGDYTVKLDKNVRLKEEIDDNGKMTQKVERDYAEFRLSPATKIVINRSVPALGERMSAFIMAFDASGEQLGDGIRVCEGRAEINGGELVAKEKLDGEEIAKRAAEATVTNAETEPKGEPEAKEESSDNNEE